MTESQAPNIQELLKQLQAQGVSMADLIQVGKTAAVVVAEEEKTAYEAGKAERESAAKLITEAFEGNVLSFGEAKVVATFKRGADGKLTDASFAITMDKLAEAVHERIDSVLELVEAVKTVRAIKVVWGADGKAAVELNSSAPRAASAPKPKVDGQPTQLRGKGWVHPSEPTVAKVLDEVFQQHATEEEKAVVANCGNSGKDRNISYSTKQKVAKRAGYSLLLP
jgi:hypothetical protein